jgi:large subunit ribosomal protein L5e
MGFIKVVKNKAYFKRYQVKYRRRRQCKTDYYARKRLIIQDKNKYKTPKYRYAVRFTNREVICQIFMADIDHDVCIASAGSHELQRYGVKLGLTNYAAAYCTGLLLARRVNAKFNLEYEGQTEVDGEIFHVEHEDEDGPAPFRALLDVGLKRTTTGSRIFGALKGACDGGLDIPHNNRRFPGTVRTDSGEWEADPDTHRSYIFGGHVSNYMSSLQEEDEDAYNKQFGAYIKAGLDADGLEGMYQSAHEQIRADPNKKRGELELGRFKTRDAPKSNEEYPKKYWKARKRPIQQRKNRIKQKLLAAGVQSFA